MSTPHQQTIVIRSLPTKIPTTLTVTQQENEMLDDLYGDGEGPRKRRRLTHLSQEEKLLRRKLKNRVAAQTARDRKKHVMTELEMKVAELERENKKLSMENVVLKAESGTLAKENQRLKGQLTQIGLSSGKTELGNGSAVSTDLLPQGQTLPVSYWMKPSAVSMLTLGLTLMLASSNQPATSRKTMSPQYSSNPCPDSPAQPQRKRKWWGPQQQNWTPSMN